MAATTHDDDAQLDDAQLDERIHQGHEAFEALEGECVSAERSIDSLQADLDGLATRLNNARRELRDKVTRRNELRQQFDVLLKLRDQRAAQAKDAQRASAAAPPPEPREVPPEPVTAAAPVPSPAPPTEVSAGEEPTAAAPEVTSAAPPSEPAAQPAATTDGADEPQAAPSHTDRALRGPLRVELDAGTDNHLFVGFSGNIEEGGIFVATYAPRSIGEELSIALSLHVGGEGEVVDCTVRVAWIMDLETSNTTGMGLRFTDLGDPGKQALQRYAADHEPMFFPD